jgi:hypothetical protein
LKGAAPFIGRSHRTLLIFRRDVRDFPKGKDIELRHQRSPDVEVQIVNTAAGACAVRPWRRSVFFLSPGGQLTPPSSRRHQTGGC